MFATLTYSRAQVRRFREAHKVEEYGRHRHLYLHEKMKLLARQLRAARPAASLSWLDYGCGKGGFIEQIRPLGLFDVIGGFDPAVPAFEARPTGRYDLVTCLHVLDVVEPRFLPAVLSDICDLTASLALFDVMTKPKGQWLKPHPPYYWTSLVRQHMPVRDFWVEYGGMAGYERVLILAEPAPPSQ